MRDKLRMVVVFLVVAVAASRGAYLSFDLARYYLDHDGRTIELAEDQAALHLVVQGQRAVVLLCDFDGEREQSRAFSAQIAATPVALRVLNGRYDREIENYLRAQVAVVLDSMTKAREAQILAQLMTTDAQFYEQRVGRDYLVLLPGPRP